MRLHTLVCLIPFAALPAQTVIATVLGANPGGHLGQTFCAAGDVDGDGVPDFVVSASSSDPTDWGTCYLVSGATHAVLQTFHGSDTGNPNVRGLGSYTINRLGDVDGDGHADFAIGYSGTGPLDVFSGATGNRIYRTGALAAVFPSVCDIGDFDGDGHSDFVACLAVNSVWQLWVCSGSTGQPLSLVRNNVSGPRLLLNVGDQNGDGTPEVAVLTYVGSAYSGDITVFDARAMAQVSYVYLGFYSSFDVGDIDGDGIPELLVCNNNNIQARSLTTGALIRTYSWAGPFCVLGDVDGDGVNDIVAITGPDPILGRDIEIISGATGVGLAGWTYQATFNSPNAMAAVGDVDGDGFPDFVIGETSLNGSSGGWQLISGRPIGASIAQPVNCSGGPFPPQLGITRPVLGSTLSIVGRDAPLGAPGALVASIMPPWPTNLGAPGCDAWIDLPNAIVVTWLPMTPTWQLSVPVPNVRTLVSTELAFQAVYLGTNGPLGYDLTNGIWARLGY